jgi:hypothetical protein
MTSSGWAIGAQLRDSPSQLRPRVSLRSGWRCERVGHDQSAGEPDVYRGNQGASTLPVDCERRFEHGGEV